MALFGKAHRKRDALRVPCFGRGLFGALAPRPLGALVIALLLLMLLLVLLMLALALAFLLGFPAMHFGRVDQVVDFAFLGIGQDLVRVLDLEEDRTHGFLVAGIAVGMPLHRGFAVGPLDFSGARIFRYAEL
ncbi:hypothetical protein LMG29739_04857 [Paraburkholderia solisilvae]|uniref:Uncharacterized protein n=1 Tax=Paraburkholderia solisilvae TaxID=624376 RepID=A0A6J5EM28_9BURK|nr:hypothetical protein LMG29739_04857 [Paraburkholderia solisilvae]